MKSCPRCKSNEHIELHRDNNNIDNLDHSHVRCSRCKYEFNVWNNISNGKLREIFENNPSYL